MRSALIRLRLRMWTAGGVTAPEALDAPEETLPLRRDTTGQIHLPGTTVVGSLRAHCEQYPSFQSTGDLPELFGPRPGASNGQRTAPPVQVLGTLYRHRGDPELVKRTAIDRVRGSAANNMLHQVEMLPAGTEFDVVLRWDDPDERFDAFLQALREWRPRLGRGASRGAGLCTVVGCGTRVYDLSAVEGLLAWLRISAPEDYPEPEPVEVDTAVAPVLDLELEIVDGLHIGAGGPAEEGRTKPNTNRVLRRGEDFLVPGTTLRGVLRSRVEYVCRVVSAPSFPDQSCGSCRPCRLFGFSGSSGRARRAKIAVHDSTITDPVLELRQHVAVDRFTGGARDQLLYTDEVITSGRFRVRVEELEPIDDTERLLLDAALTDLHDGLVGIGARTTAGLGTVRITSPHWQHPDLTALADLLHEEAA